jgi:pimeloyl-ACP methyl ester carboxylesterase
MQRANLNGADLEYEILGSGEPLLLIHGSILADAYFALRAEPRIADHYRVISYHRRNRGNKGGLKERQTLYGGGGIECPLYRDGGTIGVYESTCRPTGLPIFSLATRCKGRGHQGEEVCPRERLVDR